MTSDPPDVGPLAVFVVVGLVVGFAAGAPLQGWPASVCVLLGGAAGFGAFKLLDGPLAHWRGVEGEASDARAQQAAPLHQRTPPPAGGAQLAAPVDSESETLPKEEREASDSDSEAGVNPATTPVGEGLAPSLPHATAPVGEGLAPSLPHATAPVGEGLAPSLPPATAPVGEGLAPSLPPDAESDGDGVPLASEA